MPIGPLLAFAAISGMIGAFIGSSKGYAGIGFIVGGLLGISNATPDAQAQRERKVAEARAKLDQA